jgi:hypothetical protein
LVVAKYSDAFSVNDDNIIVILPSSHAKCQLAGGDVVVRTGGNWTTGVTSRVVGCRYL